MTVGAKARAIISKWALNRKLETDLPKCQRQATLRLLRSHAAIVGSMKGKIEDKVSRHNDASNCQFPRRRATSPGVLQQADANLYHPFQ
jgi:hypothetical protein